MEIRDDEIVEAAPTDKFGVDVFEHRRYAPCGPTRKRELPSLIGNRLLVRNEGEDPQMPGGVGVDQRDEEFVLVLSGC